MAGGEQSALQQATQRLAAVKSPEGLIQTNEFLDVCRLVLPVVGAVNTAACSGAH